MGRRCYPPALRLGGDRPVRHRFACPAGVGSDTRLLAAKDRPAIAALVYRGKPVSHELHVKLDGRWRRPRKNGQYAKFMVAILEALSSHCKHQFPPKGYEAPKNYDYYGKPSRAA